MAWSAHTHIQHPVIQVSNHYWFCFSLEFLQNTQKRIFPIEDIFEDEMLDFLRILGNRRARKLEKASIFSGKSFVRI